LALTGESYLEGQEPGVTVEEVNRILDVGRLLLSVVTKEELAELSKQCRDGAPGVDTGAR
jgi:hypothetical protein